MTPILAIPEGEDGFVVYCEALGQGLRASLMRYGRVITYVSHPLKDLANNYPAHDLEFVAVMFALKMWKHFWV